MDVVMVFLMMSGVLWLGYFLRAWHDEPDRAIRESILEQQVERRARIKAQEQFAQSWERRR